MLLPSLARFVGIESNSQLGGLPPLRAIADRPKVSISTSAIDVRSARPNGNLDEELRSPSHNRFAPQRAAMLLYYNLVAHR